ncbi:MAG: hypothetical protein JWP18_2253 [Solirubrobacterales bacterium]|nr:hypothetical protein [Solirubrobacterales bacterium]
MTPLTATSGNPQVQALVDQFKRDALPRSDGPQMPERVFIAGTPEGGHAALWATSVAPTGTPELKSPAPLR